MLVYLHGFNSSAKSEKARIALRWFKQYKPSCVIWVPTLPWEPEKAIALVQKKLDESFSRQRAAGQGDNASPVFIGSSLGGFYANYFAEKYPSRAVLINPSVYPYITLRDRLGPQQNPYTGEKYVLTMAFSLQLEKLYVSEMAHPENRLVLLQTGDETLDYREAESYYAKASCVVEQGGNHGFVGFENHLPAIGRFLF